MARTQNELIRRVLVKVGAVGSGQTASAADVALVLEVLPDVFDELAALGIVAVPYTSNAEDDVIENEVFQGIATLVALDVGPEFGLPVAPDEARQNAMNVLRRIVASRPTYEPLRADYF